ncbi:MAG: hypothetical protein L3J39_05465 [Verrucomicrobiales bacterium]|nr:hypothetical protein [Verrucomicrobiales bacterium]
MTHLPRRPLRYSAILLTLTLLFACTHSSTHATELDLQNVEGSVSSVTVKGFDQESRKIQIEKDGKDFQYALSDLAFTSKIAVLRSPELEATLAEKAQRKKQSLLLYSYVILTILALALVIGIPTFRASAFLITGQEGRIHFKVWMQILAWFILIAVIRLIVLGGITWTEVLANGYHIFRAEDGLALLSALLGAIGLVKYHYSETLQLAIITIAVHFVAFNLVIGGLGWLILRWNGGEWTTVADELLTLLILKPFELI